MIAALEPEAKVATDPRLFRAELHVPRTEHNTELAFSAFRAALIDDKLAPFYSLVLLANLSALAILAPVESWRPVPFFFHLKFPAGCKEDEVGRTPTHLGLV